jgi:hypothetical protein
MARDQPGELVVHGHDCVVRHASVRIRHQLGRDVDDPRAELAVADVLEQKVLVRQPAGNRFPAPALAGRSGLHGGDLEARRNVVIVKVDNVHRLRAPTFQFDL